MEHFVKSNENGQVPVLSLVIACILMIPTLGAPFWLMGMIDGDDKYAEQLYKLWDETYDNVFRKED